MSSDVQYYGGDRKPNNFPGYYDENSRPYSQPHQQVENFSESRHSWNEQRDGFTQSNNYYRDENTNQQPYVQPPPNQNNYDWSENRENQRNSYRPQYFEDQPYEEPQQTYGQNNEQFSSYPRQTAENSQPQNSFGYDQHRDCQNIETRMQDMKISEPYVPSDQHNYRLNSKNDSNYVEHRREPYLSSRQPEHFQNNHNQHPRHDYEEGGDNFDRSNYASSNQRPPTQLNRYDERAHLDQIQKPEIIAKTTKDGNEVAVFGVVAKLSVPSALRPQPDYQAPREQLTDGRQQQPPPQRHPERVHHLSPITEQPNPLPPSYDNEQQSGYYGNRTQGYSNESTQNRAVRYPPVLHRAGPPVSYDRPHTSNERYDGYRDEYTDSSGYGSSLTEPPYDSSLTSQKRQYPLEGEEEQYSSHRPPTNAPPTQRWQYSNHSEKSQLSYQKNDWDPPHANDDMNQYDYRKAENRHSNGRNGPREGPDQFRVYEQQNFQEYRRENFEMDDSRQMQELREVKEKFHQPGSSVSLPPNQPSYASNQYNNNTRPVPPRPRFESNNNYPPQQQKPPHPPRSPVYPPPQQISSSGRSHQTTSSHSQGPPSRQYESPPQRSNDLPDHSSSDFLRHSTASGQNHPHSSNTYQTQYLPSGNQRQEEKEYDPNYRTPLPHFDPPPQHSQSMSNLDNLQPDKSRLDIQNSGARNSYSNPYTNPETSIGAGVRFDRPFDHPLTRAQVQSQLPLLPKSFSSHQDIRQRNHTERAQEERQPNTIQSSPPEQSAPRHNNYNVQQKTQRFDKSHQDGDCQLGSPDDESHYLPNVAAQSYEKLNDDPQDNQQPQRRREAPQHTETPPDQQQFRSQSTHYKHEEQSRISSSQTLHQERQLSPDQTNFVPSVVAKSYGLFGQADKQEAQPSTDDEWPAPPTSIAQPEQRESSSSEKYGSKVYQSPSYMKSKLTQRSQDTPQQTHPQGNQSQVQARQPPTGGDSNRSYPQVPRHPFDPVDEDDSSEGVDVDADTPPPTSKHPVWPQQERGRSDHIKDLGQENQIKVANGGEINSTDHRPVPAGEKYQQSRRQPGDGLNDDQYSQSHQQQQTTSIPRSITQQKPERSSTTKFIKSSKQKETASSSANQDAAKLQSLNHDRKQGKAGKSSRKPTNGSVSSASESISDFEITVTSNDLVPHGRQPIIVHEPNMTSVKPTQKCIHSKSQAHKNLHPQNEATQTDLPLQETKPQSSQEGRKFVFKLPSEDAMKRQTAHPLPVALKQTGQDRNKPVTYSGFGSVTKEKSSSESALREQFQSARENVLRNEAKKQDRAPKLAQVFTRMTKRSPSPAKQPTRSMQDIRVDGNLDVVLKHTKETSNIYQRSKPKQNRDSALDRNTGGRQNSDASTSSRYSDRRESNRGRSRARSNERGMSPEQRGRSGSRERPASPERRGRSRSRDRLKSLERRDRPRSRERNASPDWRGRDRSRERQLVQDWARKRERDRNRPVSPSRHGRDERSQHRRREESPLRPPDRSNEPGWVEEFRKKRASDDSEARRDWINDPKWRQNKEFDINEYERRVKRATSYNSDFEQPQKKQILPAKLMAKGGSRPTNPPPNRQPPPGDDWMKNLKEHNKVAQRNRFGQMGLH